MEIHLVTGKGGVGKTTSAIALALDNPRNVPTLLVDVGGTDQTLGRTLGVGTLSNFAARWQNGVSLAHWSGESCLREYALHLLRSETLYRLFFENKVSRTLIQVAPGLAELALTGKITSGPPRNVGPKIEAQRLVIDCPASGHFLALLKAPIGMAQTFRFGPMADQSRAILEVLKNARQVHIHVVTLADVLPLEEAFELAHEIHQLIGQKSHFIFNKWKGIPEGVEHEPPTPRQQFLMAKKIHQHKALNAAQNSAYIRSLTRQDFILQSEPMAALYLQIKRMSVEKPE